MRRFSSLLMTLMVTVLLWGNCARCTTILPPDSESGSHDCCHKSQNGKPLKQICDLNAADLSKATAAQQHQAQQPSLAEAGAVVVLASTLVPAPVFPVMEPVVSPPPFQLLYSVFRI